MPFLSYLFLNMSICAIICTLKKTHGYVLALNPWLCFGFKLVWVEKIVGLVFVGLKMTLDGYGSSMVLRDTCTGMVQVWFKYETILRFITPGHHVVSRNDELSQRCTLGENTILS